MEDQDRDIKKIDKSIRGLFTLLRTILETNEKRNLKITRKRNPILSRLDKYVKIYEKTKIEDHINHFERIYESNHINIMKGPDRDAWIKNNNIMIQSSPDAKIYLSGIYNTSCKLKTDIENSFRGLPDIGDSLELKFSTAFLLHLYRIFYEISDSESDQKILSGYISKLEKNAGVKKSKKAGGGAFDGVMDMATGFMEKMGIKLPKGQKMPDLGQLMNDPRANSVFKQVKECNNIQDLLGKVMGGLGGMGASAGNNNSNLDGLEGGEIGGTDFVEGTEFVEGGDEFVGNDAGGDEFVGEGDEFVEGGDEFVGTE